MFWAPLRLQGTILYGRCRLYLFPHHDTELFRTTNQMHLFSQPEEYPSACAGRYVSRIWTVYLFMVVCGSRIYSLSYFMAN